jgi:hypothetical protein
LWRKLRAVMLVTVKVELTALKLLLRLAPVLRVAVERAR